MKHDLSEWLVVSGHPSFELGGDGFPRPGQVLKHYRCSQRTTWTQADLAHVLSVSTQAVRDMENRDIGFTIERRRFLAKLFNIPPALLGIVTLEEFLKQFAEQKDEFPRPGEVLKHYRYLKMKNNKTAWTQADLAYVLGTSIQAVRDMENRDIGFTIERRRFLAKLFDIPPVLLGIVTLEELLKQGVGEENRRERLHSSKKMLIDEQEYQAALQNYWSSHHSRAPHNATSDILRRIAILEATLSSMSGQQKIHRMEMLSEYHQLMGMILRDLQKFDDALTHLSHAVQFATYAEGNAELLAVSHYRRGVVALDKERVLHDKQALLVAHDVFSFALTLKKHIPLSLLNAVLLKGGHTYARVAKSDEGQLQGLKMMDQAGNIARNLTGQGHSYHFRTDVDHYHIDKGAVLVAIGRPKDAIVELSIPSEKPEFTRRNIYRDILLAQAYIDTGDYLYSLSLADAALSLAKNISSDVTIARIKSLYTQLIVPTCPIKNNPEVARLGYRLKTY